MKRRSLLLAFVGTSAVAACASVDTEQTTSVHAIVETVDPNSRELLVRGDAGAQSGRLVSMVVSPRVQRLDQIRPGDHVLVTYYQAIAANVVNAFSGSASVPADTSSVYRGETASRPNGEVTRVRRARVTITAVDPAADTVSFIGPNRVERTVQVRNGQVRAFVRQLRPGQQVDIVYEEALAISVQSAA